MLFTLFSHFYTKLLDYSIILSFKEKLIFDKKPIVCKTKSYVVKYLGLWDYERFIMMDYTLGIDIGSTTVKIAILDKDNKAFAQGMLEISNVTPFTEVTDVLRITASMKASFKMMTIIDDMYKKGIDYNS